MPQINKFNWGRFGKGIEIDQWIKVLAIKALRSEFDSDVIVDTCYPSTVTSRPEAEIGKWPESFQVS